MTPPRITGPIDPLVVVSTHTHTHGSTYALILFGILLACIPCALLFPICARNSLRIRHLQGRSTRGYESNYTVADYGNEGYAGGQYSTTGKYSVMTNIVLSWYKIVQETTVKCYVQREGGVREKQMQTFA